MAENQKVTARAPYNFVPFSSKVLIRYENADQLPPHDRIDPALKTGEIHVTIKAETPIFISDGNRNPDFFRNAEGKFAIPGSSVRGLLRQNMMILGYGLPRPGEDLEDYQVYFRDMTAAKKSVANARREYYKAALNIVTEQHNQKPVSKPKNVQAGYLHKENGKYYIQPIAGEVFRVPRSHPDLAQFPSRDASTCFVSYTASSDTVKEIKPAGTAGMQSGMLLYTGKHVGQKANPVYLFPQEDPSQPAIQPSEWDVLSYEVDYKSRANSLRENKSFWALPDEGKMKPVFYCALDGHIYFGMTRFLRIGYKHSLLEGLPKKHKELLNEDPFVLDYPSAIFGYARKAGRNQQSYRSRVSVGDFVLCTSATQMQDITTVLGEPKPSYYPGYVVDGKDYNQDDFRLRGYKQYWMKPAQAQQSANPNENVQTRLKPLKEGCAFRGVIRYKNLSDDELGLLLWTLKLEEGCFQSLGMGKPYGYGRVTVSVDKLTSLDLDSLYTLQGFCSDARDETTEIDRYIRCYDEYASKRLDVKKGKKSVSIRSMREIEDFFFMKKPVQEPVQASYMELKEFKDISAPLPDVTQLRKETVESAPKKADSEIDPFEKLRAMYGSKNKRR